jgi:putative transcriptional regulator
LDRKAGEGVMKKSMGARITERLSAFAKALENDEDITRRFTCRKIELALEPQVYSPEMVKDTRKILGLSQALFARFLGLCVKSVSAWEQGTKTPSDIACRFMDEIRHDPKYWQGRLRASAVQKVVVS